MYTDKNVATNMTIAISNATGDANTSLSNYNISYVNSTNSSITAKSLVLTASAQTKTYDGALTVSNAAAYTASGLVTGETIAATTLAYTDQNAGTNKTIAISSAVAGTNTSLSNYDISYVNNSASTITTKSLVVTASAQNKTYDGTLAVTNSAAYTVSGLVTNESIASATLAYTDKNAGSNKTIVINSAVAGANTLLSNYNVSYVNRTGNTITTKALVLTASQQTKTYDGTTVVADTAAYTSSGLVTGETIIGTTLAYTDKNAGSNKTIAISTAIAGTNTSLSNYNISYVNSSTSTITTKALTLTASAQTKTYDGTLTVSNASAYTSSGLVTGETITSATLAYTDKNAGSNKTIAINAAVAGTNTSLSNYNVSYVNSSTSTITTKALTLTASAQSKTYDSTAAVSNASAYSVSATLAYTDKNAGSNKTIAISSAVAGTNTSLSNYNVSYVNSSTSTITTKALTLTASAQSKTYDSTTAVSNASAYSVSGLVTGETITSATLAYTDKNAGSNKTIVINAAVAGTNTSLSNYNVSYVNSSGNTISKANITGITNVSLSDKTYDGTTVASFNVTGANFTGMFAGDSLNLSGGTGGFASKNVGSNIAVSVSGLTLGGTDAGNYNVVGGTPSFNGTANITAKSLVLTASAQTKTYDSTTAVSNASAYSVSGLVTGETITSATLAYTDKNAGSNKTIAISSAVAGTNTSLSNYNVSYVNSSGNTISKAVVTVVSSNVTKTYDGTMAITNASSVLSGVIAGDQVVATSSGTMASKSAGNNISYNLTNHVILGTDSGNYYIDPTTPALTGSNGVINKLVINSVKGITANSKSYDGTNSAIINLNGAIAPGVIAGDQVNVASASGAFSDASVGVNKTVFITNITLGGADSSNYQLFNTSSNAYASITSNSSGTGGSTNLTATTSEAYTANVISKINKIEFTQPVYSYLFNIRKNPDYLQVNYIEKGVNLSVASQ